MWGRGPQPPTQASPGTSSGPAGRWQCGCHQSLLPVLIPGVCQLFMGQLLAFPPTPGDGCGVMCWNLLLFGWIWAEESWQGWQGGRALVGVLLQDQNSTSLPG